MYGYRDRECAELNSLVGKKISSISGLEKGSDEVFINTECGDGFVLFHAQDCCECVDLDDFETTSNSLLGGEVLLFEERTSCGDEDYGDTFTWTFYELKTTKGDLSMKWYGTSNGYYSESVYFAKVNKKAAI